MSPAAGSPPDADPARPGPAPSVADTESAERRRFLVAGAVFLGALVVLIARRRPVQRRRRRPAHHGDDRRRAPSDDVECRAAQQSAERPGIIPRPGEGQAPAEPGDRGGWEQIAVFVALVAGVSLIIALVVRSARRDRARARDRGPLRPAPRPSLRADRTRCRRRPRTARTLDGWLALPPCSRPSLASTSDAGDGGGFFLGDDLLAYLLLAFGGAMLVGNLFAVLRPPPERVAEGTRGAGRGGAW